MVEQQRFVRIMTLQGNGLELAVGDSQEFPASHLGSNFGGLGLKFMEFRARFGRCPHAARSGPGCWNHHWNRHSVALRLRQASWYGKSIKTRDCDTYLTLVSMWCGAKVRPGYGACTGTGCLRIVRRCSSCIELLKTKQG